MATKTLLILDLNGVLGKMTKQFKPDKFKPVYHQGNCAIYQRPDLDKITFHLMVRKKSMYDVAVWSSADFLDTKLMVEFLFGRYLS